MLGKWNKKKRRYLIFLNIIKLDTSKFMTDKQHVQINYIFLRDQVYSAMHKGYLSCSIYKFVWLKYVFYPYN